VRRRGAGHAEEERQILRIKKQEANKSVWWMPRHQGPKKDAEHCEKPRGAVCRRRTGGIRMGKPGWRKASHGVWNT
jgi:hypothetical protein